ncbi:MAG TPA: hypothetical protein VFM73_08215 [Xanthomonadaceae bacterium]|nr:hypothetical protein [Xanthomonadaceae bacterium]
MPWIYLLLAVAAFAGALLTPSMMLMVLCLLAALGLMLAWALALYASRVGTRRNDIPMPPDAGPR